MKIARLVTRLAHPLRSLDRRSSTLELLTRTPLTERDVAALRAANELSGRTLGDFYHWYLQKLFIARSIRNLDRRRVLDFISSVDCTDYSQLSRIVDQPAGVLVAIPHHGHYIFSMIGLAEKLRRHRQVWVFYGQPSTHKGNEIFDSLHSVLWNREEAVNVVHDTRQGMAQVIRALKGGHVVLIMPDVFTNELATVVIPFFERPMNIMLGTATLARKTGAWVLPAVSKPQKRGLGYKTCFGERLGARHASGSPEFAQVADYWLMRQLFSQYELLMEKELPYWQFVRAHMSKRESYRPLPGSELKKALDLLSNDPLVSGPSQTLDLRAAGGQIQP